MRLNEHTAISTASALLVPYDHRHVQTYHAWMKDPAIQEATASEPLTLEEEYENQESWRASHDKLTFIVCQPLPSPPPPPSSSAPNPSSGSETKSESESFPSGDSGSGSGSVSESERSTIIQAGAHDAPEKMIGDVNLFLYPDEEEEEEEGGGGGGGGSRHHSLPDMPKFCVGEVDIMIANDKDRGRGLGREVVRAFLSYVSRRETEIMNEYAEDKDIVPPPRLKMVMAKVGQTNERSLALFEALGFEQEGEANYFGEVKLVLRDLDRFVRENPVRGYKECVYFRA